MSSQLALVPTQSESSLQADIRLGTGRLPRVRLFRNSRGVFWAGKVIARDATSITLSHPRQVEAGLTDGASDLIGLTQVVITPDMVGETVAIFTAAEIKLPGVRVPQHQQRFVDFVHGFGGIAGIVRSVADALKLVRAL